MANSDTGFQSVFDRIRGANLRREAERASVAAIRVPKICRASGASEARAWADRQAPGYYTLHCEHKKLVVERCSACKRTASQGADNLSLLLLGLRNQIRNKGR